MIKNLVACAVLALLSIHAHAQEESVLDQLTVRGKKTNDILPTFPSTAVSIDAETIAETVNAVDAPDALKYFPGIFVRKRDSADYNGSPVGSRVWGNAYSAKSIVTVDGVPITNQIFQNNSQGSPKWWVTSPDEIQTIEVMYGPFSAAYGGNAMGVVVNMATQMPEKFVATANTTLATQQFKKYGTSDTNNTGVLNLMLGNKNGDLAWRVSFNHEDATTQPRAWVTSDKTSLTPYAYSNKNLTSTGSYAGAGGIVDGVSDNLSLKLHYDLTSDLKLGVLTGLWQGNSDASVQSYLTGSQAFTNYTTADATVGKITWQDKSNANAFFQDQLHAFNAISLKTKADQKFSWEMAFSNFDYMLDRQRWSGGASNATAYLNADGTMKTSSTGYIRDFGGTGWTNWDLRGNYRTDTGVNTLSFGFHQDDNYLSNVLTAGNDWATKKTLTTEDTIAKGKSQTMALWLQNMWKVSNAVTVTGGLRAEYWRAYDGYNLASATPFVQPSKHASGYSPKISMMFDGSHNWVTTASLAKTSRFPTLEELYAVATCNKTVSASGACAVSDYISTGKFDLKPEQVTSAELSFEKIESTHNVRFTVFGESVQDAILSQYGKLSSANPNGLYGYWVNVEKVHAYGLELAGMVRNVGVQGLDLSGQVTRVWSAIDESSTLGGLRQSVEGNPLTYVSPLRAMAMATYRPDEKWTYNASVRYQQAGASSLDNNDYKRDTYGGFQSFTVVDTKVRYKIDKQWTASAGIDNLFNQDYWIYHPFPQRTFVANLKYVH